MRKVYRNKEKEKSELTPAFSMEVFLILFGFLFRFSVLLFQLGENRGEKFFLSRLRRIGSNGNRTFFGVLLIIGFASIRFELKALIVQRSNDLDNDEQSQRDDEEGDDRVDAGSSVDDRGEVVGPGLPMEGVKALQRVLPLNKAGIFGGDGDALARGIGDGGLRQIGEALADPIDARLDFVGRRKDGDQPLNATRDTPSADTDEDVGEGGDDRIERSADHDADGEVEGVSAVDEGFEIVPKALALFLEFALFFFFLRHKIVPFFLDLQMNGNTIGPPKNEFNAQNLFFLYRQSKGPNCAKRKFDFVKQ